MNFSEALKHVLNGKLVKRTSKESTGLVLGASDTLYSFDLTSYNNKEHELTLSKDDIEAQDWAVRVIEWRE